MAVGSAVMNRPGRGDTQQSKGHPGKLRLLGLRLVSWGLLRMGVALRLQRQEVTLVGG